MKTLSNYQKIPLIDLGEIINQDVEHMQLERYNLLIKSHLSGPGVVNDIEEATKLFYETASLNYTLGYIQGLLIETIGRLQTTEITLEHTEDELKDALKMSV